MMSDENKVVYVRRFVNDGDITLSTMAVDGRFICFGVEDGPSPKGDVKVPGKTRIPQGSYPVVLRRIGGFHTRYSRRYGEKHKGMLWLRDIPDFEFVLIHIGNDQDDTEGCLLPNHMVSAEPGGMKGGYSASAYFRLYDAVVEAAAQEKLSITIVDED